ncbi:DEAD/DEAH box helicase [Clostridium perfringens]
MLKEVIELQNNAVENLLIQTNVKNEITFKSPTGTGKTYMMADYMNRIISKNPDVVFIVSSLSKGDLAKQNEEKFKEYIAQCKFTSLKPFLISTEGSTEEGLHIPTNYNVYILPRDLYKKNGKLMQGCMTNFLNSITSKHLMNGLNKKIYLIKDECHIGTNNLDSISNEYFTKVINISATPDPKKGQIPDVEIKEKDAISTRLIKSVVWGDESDTLVDALYMYKKIKKEYILRVGINPCMIIQISNKNEAERELRDIIFPALNSSDFNDLKWMLIVNQKNECNTNDRIKTTNLPISKWKEYAKSNNSSIDIIIFKMVITEGWDIPRACMLYQERNTQSEQLKEQVMGRVRRNPCLLNYEKLDSKTQELVSKAYVWGVKSNTKEIPVKVKEGTENTLNIMTTRLKRSEKKKSFDIKRLVDGQPVPPSYGSIFDLYKNFNKLDFETKQDCFDNINDYSEWYRYAYYSSKIQTEFKKYICNYEETMELLKDDFGNVKLVSFPVFSMYDDNKHYLKIKNWVWCRGDGQSKFSFDSEAEKEFAEELKDFVSDESETKNDFLWGKNFLPNSEIRFEYYWEGIHSSYPDFILRDKYQQIHIFEVKSINEAYSISLDREKYLEKIRVLEECYKQAAILTGYCFYLPIKNGSTWDITKIEKDGSSFKITRNLSIDTILDAIK